MRYTQLTAFQKHLAASAPHHLSRLYFIASPDDFERKQVLDSVLSYILTPDTLVSRFTGSEASSRTVLDALNSPMLLGGEPIVLVDEIDKKLLDALGLWFKEAPSFGYLLIGSKSKAAAASIEQHGIVLDLMEEKQWEKEKRWIEKLYEKARSAGKCLSSDAAALILEKLESDAAVLTHEMDKLLCYTADKSSIERVDVEAICCCSRTYTLWKIAEDLIWEKIFRVNVLDLHDSSFFHSLIPGLRQQLTIGAKMYALHSSEVPFSEWGAYFPKMWPKTLEKKAMAAQRLGPAYFRQGLERLFTIELLAKSGPVPTDALLDLFRTRLIPPCVN